ncbi:MAG: GNAT family N-acetyltransferase, partial [Actinomycetota bacterium]|nr:GNAT family N-acetyltransferase [Actinomycetota bacterium]
MLEHLGSSVADRGDHLVVRTPANADFHWGNCIFVTDADALDDAARWVDAFEAAVTGADWIAIGLPRMPADVQGWTRCGIELELDDVLATTSLPPLTTPPAGYDVRPLVGRDWEQLVERVMTFNEPTQERFVTARVQSQRDMAERGAALFVGAFFGGRLVAELGIVDCGATARYQDVGTALEHRGRGLASHLLGVAAQWASTRGCEQLVIVTEAANPAGRVYRRAGFELV